MSDELGKVRRSQIVMTHGPGAIIDFRAGGKGGAPVSVVATGLDDWDRHAPPTGLFNTQRISEPRLEKVLNVRGFRLPPVAEDTFSGKAATDGPVLTGRRFPEWLTCPICTLLQPVRRWNEDPGDPAPYCRRCSDLKGRRIHVVPARFIVACESGHLDEFPWSDWVPHDDTCAKRKPLMLKGVGSGLRGLVLSCTACGKQRSMDGAFSPQSMRDLKVYCSGRRPWLGGAPERCSHIPTVVQRGASNLYFAATESALSIPPWEDSLQRVIGEDWIKITSAASDGDQERVIRELIFPYWEGSENAEELVALIRERLRLLNAQNTDNLRSSEYPQLRTDRSTQDEASELSVRFEPVKQGLRPYFSHVTQVTRLREVRALKGFTRIHPPGGDSSLAELTLTKKHWLPAVEVRGEGIFLSLNDERLRLWEERKVVKERAAVLDERYRKALRERQGDDAKPDFPVTARYLLVHTLAHVLMKELALECGYSSASLRERLYVEAGDPGMCGVLIYTAAADADGTLGGLVQQGRPDRIDLLLRSAIDAARWCSSDPLCIDGAASLLEGFNHAACHSCALAPETSCETFNHFLDRAVLIGQPEDQSLLEEERLGFFTDLKTMEPV